MNQPKYQIGQKVWRVRWGGSDGFKIKKVSINGMLFTKRGRWEYCHDIPSEYSEAYWCQEKQLFPSKEELIKSL